MRARRGPGGPAPAGGRDGNRYCRRCRATRAGRPRARRARGPGVQALAIVGGDPPLLHAGRWRADRPVWEEGEAVDHGAPREPRHGAEGERDYPAPAAGGRRLSAVAGAPRSLTAPRCPEARRRPSGRSGDPGRKMTERPASRRGGAGHRGSGPAQCRSAMSAARARRRRLASSHEAGRWPPVTPVDGEGIRLACDRSRSRRVKCPAPGRSFPP